MKYTYQRISDSGSFSSPYPDDVEHASSKRELARALDRWADEHDRCGVDREAAFLNIWVGHHDHANPNGFDLFAYEGRRGGFVMERA